MNDAGSVAEKDALRRRVRHERAAEPPSVRAERARRLVAQVDAVVAVAGPGLAGFQPTNDEPDISLLLRAVLPDVLVVLPRVVGDDLEWVGASDDDLVAGLTGIPEPAGTVIATGAGIVHLGVGAILVPALAVDPATGFRVGYGRGFYDRLLAGVRAFPAAPVAVGVCRDADLTSVPSEPHDEPVDAVLTESGLITVGPHP